MLPRTLPKQPVTKLPSLPPVVRKMPPLFTSNSRTPPRTVINPFANNGKKMLPWPVRRGNNTVPKKRNFLPFLNRNRKIGFFPVKKPVEQRRPSPGRNNQPKVGFFPVKRPVEQRRPSPGRNNTPKVGFFPVKKPVEQRRPSKPSGVAGSAAIARPTLTLRSSGAAAAAATGANCLANFNGAAFATVASTYQRNYKAHGTIYSQAKRQFGLNVQYSDCSSFVSSVMTAAGYGCLFVGSKANTAAMVPEERARGGFHSVPRVGDLVMWTSHTGIVTAVGNGVATMVAMGVHGCANTGMIALSKIPGWGSGSFLGYWTPRA